MRLAFASELPEALEAMRARIVLPGWTVAPLTAEPTWILACDRGVYRVQSDQGEVLAEPDLAKVVDALAALAHHHVAAHADEAVFVHAGVVGYEGRGVLLPGSSFAGKSTLTAALVAAGATYYSDEYAVFEPGTGLVRAFPRELSLRERRLSLEELNWRGVPPALRVQGVFALRYDDSTDWRVEELSRGETVLAVFAHAVAAQRLGAGAVLALQRGLAEARGWQGTRGDASQAVLSLRRWLES